LNFAADAISGNAIDLTPETGTFDVGWETACTTTPSDTWHYARVGNIVTLKADASNFTCTSDSTLFSAGADIPANLRPTISGANAVVFAQDNGVEIPALLTIGTTGGVSVLTTAFGVSSWSNVGTKGLGYVSISYPLN
jgi:hypothetical protein